MKKRIFAIATTLIVVVSLFASMPVIADENETEVVGGLDFYSITLHYENPVLVSYYSTKIEIEDEKGKTKKVSVEYFYNTDAESEEEKYMDGDKALTSDKLVIPAGTTSGQKFYQVSAASDTADKISSSMWYAKIPYVNAFLTHITNGSAICTTGKEDLFGITDPYDDNPYVHQNPNLKYAEDGYALANELDANGNNLKIDINGYLIDTNNNIWKNSNDERVELYTQIPVLKKTGEYKQLKKCPNCGTRKDNSITTNIWTCDCGTEVKGDPLTAIYLSEEYEWVPFNDRFDENGKIVDIQTLAYNYMITEEEYDNFIADDSQVSIKLYRTDDEEAFDDAPTKGKEVSYVRTCIVDKTKDEATYWNTDRVFTNSDMVVDENGYVAYSTPRVGTPVINIKVKDITVEIDALGAQLYDDLANDPQQNNTITVSVNDCEYNSKLYKQWFDEGLYTQEEYDALAKFVLGTAKSKTTRTEITMTKGDYKAKDEFGYSPTVASISIGADAEILSKLPMNAKIYVDFDINTNQPAEAWDATYQKKMVTKTNDESTVISERVDLLTDEDKPVKEKPPVKDEGFPLWAIIAIAAGGVVVVAAVVVVIIISKKKKG